MEKERKEDARVVRTRRDLRAAMTALMERRGFDKITVSDVCAAAMVNRMTFYKHYRDKYDLLNDVILDVKNSIVRRMEEAGPVPGIADDPGRLFRAAHRRGARRVSRAPGGADRARQRPARRDDGVLVAGKVRRRPFERARPQTSAAVQGGGAGGGHDRRLASFLVRYWLGHRPEQTKEQLLGRSKAFLRDLFAARILFK